MRSRKTVHKRRLLRLARFLRKLPSERFDYTTWGRTTSCGTVACAVGHCPDVFPTYWRRDNDYPELRESPYSSPLIDAMRFFGLSYDAAAFLFSPNSYNGYGYGQPLPYLSNVSPALVADHIENFVKKFSNHLDVEQI